MIRNWRAAAAALGAGILGAVAFAAPAAADVSVTPSAAIRGGPAEFAFMFPEERPGAHTTQIELVAPEDAVIAEMYPLSDPNWAPSTTTRTVDNAAELIHGSTTNEVTA